MGRGIRSVLTPLAPVYDGAEQALRARLARTSVADALRDSIAKR